MDKDKNKSDISRTAAALIYTVIVRNIQYMIHILRMFVMWADNECALIHV